MLADTERPDSCNECEGDISNTYCCNCTNCHGELWECCESENCYGACVRAGRCECECHK